MYFLSIRFVMKGKLLVPVLWPNIGFDGTAATLIADFS